jgi:transcriptional regulator with XRE-family HTH domain
MIAEIHFGYNSQIWKAMDFSGNQLKAARVMLGLDQATFAKAVGASVNTIKTMEGRGHEPVGGFASTRDRVREALEAMGIRFTNGDAPGVIWLRKGSKVAAARPRRPAKPK